MAYHLAQPQIDALVKTLEKHGYGHYNELARAISLGGHYTYGSARSLLNKVLSKERPMPDVLARTLFELCERDKKVAFLQNPDSPRKSNKLDMPQADRPVEYAIILYLKQIERKIEKVSFDTQIRLVKNLERIVEYLKD